MNTKRTHQTLKGRTKFSPEPLHVHVDHVVVHGPQQRSRFEYQIDLERAIRKAVQDQGVDGLTGRSLELRRGRRSEDSE